MDEIERQMSDAKAANIDVSWLQAHLEAIHISNKCNLLMEMKSNTILVNRAAQMDLRERCAELVAALQQFQQAERCVRVLHLVEKNLNDNILESKAIIDSWEQSKRSVAATKVRQSDQAEGEELVEESKDDKKGSQDVGALLLCSLLAENNLEKMR
ncbi:hypothetical protein E3N88_10038 [Mikania micrantha]|uniref:Uncharacterized protein n=1 Tax=Mikania micrantha TaxID=192012 RepID=A0A5N6PBU3_9ASTR|nr:hypothetical protein E3N88_10038 [Mikania micrantha]